MEGIVTARKRSRPETANGAAAAGKRSKGEASLSHESRPLSASIALVLLDVGCPRSLREVFRRLDFACVVREQSEGVLVGRLIMLMRAVCAMRCTSGVLVAGDW